MPRKRAKKTIKKPAAAAPQEEEATDLPISLIHREVERQSAAIRATREVEIERLLTDLRLLKSCFTQEQLRAPAGMVLRESFPNLSFEKGVLDVELKETGEDISVGEAAYEKEYMNRFSCTSYRDFSAIRSLGGLELTNDAVRTAFLGGDGFQTRDMVFEGQSGAPVFGMQDGLQTPGFHAILRKYSMPYCGGVMCGRIKQSTVPVDWCFPLFSNNQSPPLYESAVLGSLVSYQRHITPLPELRFTSQRLSIGMTPKTLRVPKPGEMLLSVRGSPLGVYKEENMEAIHESEEG